MMSDESRDGMQDVVRGAFAAYDVQGEQVIKDKPDREEQDANGFFAQAFQSAVDALHEAQVSLVKEVCTTADMPTTVDGPASGRRKKPKKDSPGPNMTKGRGQDIVQVTSDGRTRGY